MYARLQSGSSDSVELSR